LEKVKKTRGFVLQIQQGIEHEKSDMQVAEEMQSGWLRIPRIGKFAFPGIESRGGGSLAEERLAKAVEVARRQWKEGIRETVELVDEVFEPIDGATELPMKGSNVHGRARCILPSGAVYEGDFKDGFRHGTGKNTSASGNVYEGEYKEGERHGKGKYTNVDGDVEVGFYESGKEKGVGVGISKDRTQAWLLRDGELEREIGGRRGPEKGKEAEIAGASVSDPPNLRCHLCCVPFLLCPAPGAGVSLVASIYTGCFHPCC